MRFGEREGIQIPNLLIRSFTSRLSERVLSFLEFSLSINLSVNSFLMCLCYLYVSEVRRANCDQFFEMSQAIYFCRSIPSSSRGKENGGPGSEKRDL